MRILYCDPIARYLAVVPLAALLFFGVVPLALGDVRWLWLGVPLTLAGLALPAARVRALRRLLRHGTAVPGEVLAVTRERGVTHVEYTYAYLGRRRHGTNYTLAPAAGLAPGGAVTVAVDRQAPQRSLVRELFA